MSHREILTINVDQCSNYLIQHNPLLCLLTRLMSLVLTMEDTDLKDVGIDKKGHRGHFKFLRSTYF